MFLDVRRRATVSLETRLLLWHRSPLLHFRTIRVCTWLRVSQRTWQNRFALCEWVWYLPRYWFWYHMPPLWRTAFSTSSPAHCNVCNVWIK